MTHVAYYGTEGKDKNIIACTIFVYTLTTELLVSMDSHWHGVRQNFRRRGFIRGFAFFLIFRPILIPWFWILLFSNIFWREEIEVCIFWWNQCNQIFNISNPVKNQILMKNSRKICFLFYLIKTWLNLVTLLCAAGWLTENCK